MFRIMSGAKMLSGVINNAAGGCLGQSIVSEHTLVTS